MSEILVLEGRNIVLEALESGFRPLRLYVEAGASGQGKVERILELASSLGVAVTAVPRDRLNRLSRTGVHQGVVAHLEAPGSGLTLSGLLDSLEEKGVAPFLLVLCRVMLDQNLGALLRSANASGVHGVVVPTRGSAVPGPEVVRVSAGGALHVPVVQEGLHSALKTLKRRGVWIAGAEAGAGKPYYEADLTGPLALVLGGEDEGLSNAVAGACDHLVHIPITGRVPSLNVAAAGAVLMFEKARQEALRRP